MNGNMASDPPKSILPVTFSCLYAPVLELEIDVKNEDRAEALHQAWAQAMMKYNPHGVDKLKRQLKRKLGPIYSFYDLSDVILTFINTDGKREEIHCNAASYPINPDDYPDELN